MDISLGDLLNLTIPQLTSEELVRPSISRAPPPLPAAWREPTARQEGQRLPPLAMQQTAPEPGGFPQARSHLFHDLWRLKPAFVEDGLWNVIPEFREVGVLHKPHKVHIVGVQRLSPVNEAF